MQDQPPSGEQRGAPAPPSWGRGPGTVRPPGAPPEQAPRYPPAASGDGPSGPRAGFWQRFAAALVDGILLAVVDAILLGLFGEPGRAMGLVVSLSYFTYFEGSPSGQTVGKRALGIRVIDLDGGGSIGHGRAFIRWIGRFVSSVVLLLGYFWMIWDREKQTWHDKFANSVVVPVDAYPVTKWPG
jgi:uncharacterized RDD family membrane protein YckC